ncbi:peptidoglycan DD-metalloendopeptidase family protein [Aquibium carbonis]
MRVLGANGRGFYRLAAVLAATTFLAGCSSGVTRFNESIFTDDLMTGSTANQRSIIKNNAQQPFPGDNRVAAAPPPASGQYGNANERYAASAPSGGIQRSSLPPMAAGQSAPMQPAPVEMARATAPVQVDRTVTNTTVPVSAAASAAQDGWSKVGGTVVSVRQGETLYNMSKRFGVPVKEILKANDMASANDLAAGQKVIIPTYVYSRQAPVSAPDNDPRVLAASSTRGLQNDAPNAPRPASAPSQAVAALPQAPRPNAPAANTLQAPSASTPRVATSNAGNVYTVVSGDTLNAVARKTGTTTAQLKAANGLGDGYLRIGQKLTIPGGGGTTTVAATTAPAAAPAIDPIKTSSANQPAPKAAAPSPVTAYTPPSKDEKVIKEAVTQTAAIAPQATGVGKMRWPVRGRVIESYGRTSGGRVNDGIDIAVPEGTSVKAAENGVVIYAGDGLKEFGNTVLVRHEDGLVSVYGHASELTVKRGDKVRRGQEIARSGMSGSADTPKLHFEVRKDSAPVDPVKYLE